MKRAIVTGATGFVGSYLVKQLHESGYQVCALVHSEQSVPILPFAQEVIVVPCNLSEYGSVAKSQWLVKFHGADVFFHLAWEGSAGEQRSDYALQLKNVLYTCNATRLAAELGCGRFVGAGSIMEDELQHTLPRDEAIPVSTYHYSSAKYAAFLMAKTEAASNQVPFLWGKISNAYGALDPTARFVNTMLRKMLDDQPCRLSPCTQLYDFIYISELARAFQLIGEKGIPGKAYYIGSGAARPLREFVEIMRKSTATRSDITYGALPGGIALDDSCFDSRKLQMDTGFQCNIDFPSGIQKTLESLSEGA